MNTQNELLNADGLDEYFSNFNKKQSSQQSDYNRVRVSISPIDLSGWDNIGDDFYSQGGKLMKKYIDGTLQGGLILDSNGQCRCGDEVAVAVGNSGGYRNEITLIPYPKDKGFVKGDGKGNYFYFPPLSDFKVSEIKRLEKLRDTAIVAENNAKNASAKDALLAKAQAERAKKDFEVKKAESEKKSAIENNKKSQKEGSDIDEESQDKIMGLNKKHFIIGAGLVGSLIIGLTIFLIIKKRK